MRPKDLNRYSLHNSSGAKDLRFCVEHCKQIFQQSRVRIFPYWTHSSARLKNLDFALYIL